MKSKAVSVIMLTLLSISMLTLAFDIQPVKAGGTIYIRADGSVYPDTAPISSVDNVTYTFTDNIYDEIVVERNNIVVDGAVYTLQGTGALRSKGISLTDRSNVTIKNMEINLFCWGIYLYSSLNTSISGNNIANNLYGIHLSYSSSSSISGNNIENNNYAGIYLSGFSNYNSISGNNITANNWHGVYHYYSWSSSISGNSITANSGCGIWLRRSSSSSISGNNITANNQDGIALRRSSSSSISGNNITANNWNGIYLVHFSSSSISGNNIANNLGGICFWSSSNYNSISGNSITANNQYGVSLWWSSYNKFYHNNFIDNTQQVYDYSWDDPSYPPSINIWDDGYPSGGNYWSDHITVDDYSGVYQNELGSDGIVDEPYIIDEENRDNYPLVIPFPSPVGPIRELIETIKSWNLPKGTETCLTKKLYAAISLLEMGNLNGAIRKVGDFIDQVENDRKDLTEEQRSELIFRAQRIIDLIKG